MIAVSVVGPSFVTPSLSLSSSLLSQGSRVGGKGTVRRKRKAAPKATNTDDKRLQGSLKRLGVNTIPGIEEVCC